jgi:hypothetical protein
LRLVFVDWGQSGLSPFSGIVYIGSRCECGGVRFWV